MESTRSVGLSESQRAVREHYGEVACRAGQAGGSQAQGSEAQAPGGQAPGGQAQLYPSADREALPAQACSASRGCGNPLAQAGLREGERVLDLGCGGGIDVLLAARQVGGSGHVYGLDMTPEMLALAERNAAEAAVSNVSFIGGLIEDIPLPSGSVDVVTSNCVINLSDDKGAVLREAWRVLVPGGRIVVADIVLERPGLPAAMRRAAACILGCTNDVLTIREYEGLMREAGFGEVVVEPYRRSSWQSLEAKAERRGQQALLAQLDPQQVDDALASAYITGRKECIIS
ncbi:MAG: methyltransferase domain-containing protein [Coriobacteriales bacterium]|nr:methyltransferase domain-containing protein [Coriobacteriales bacterium]